MQRAGEYLKRAATAEEAAAKARDPEVRRDWERVAEQWRAIARQAVQLAADEEGRTRPEPGSFAPTSEAESLRLFGDPDDG